MKYYLSVLVLTLCRPHSINIINYVHKAGTGWCEQWHIVAVWLPGGLQMINDRHKSVMYFFTHDVVYVHWASLTVNDENSTWCWHLTCSLWPVMLSFKVTFYVFVACVCFSYPWELSLPPPSGTTFTIAFFATQLLSLSYVQLKYEIALLFI
jgi:hypothetical protein